jgi:hypothetical protein
MAAFGAIGVTLFVKLPLLVSFSRDWWLVIANVEHHVTTPGWKSWDQRETRRVWQWIQIVFVVVEVFSLGIDRACRPSAGATFFGQCMNRAFIMFSDIDHVDSIARWWSRYI